MNCGHLEQINEIASRYKKGQAFLTSNGDSQKYWQLKKEHLKCSLEYMLDYSEMMIPEDKGMVKYLKEKIKELESIN